MIFIKPLTLFLLFIFILTGCSVKIEQKKEISQAKIQKAQWEELKGFDTDNLTLALEVFKKDCQKAVRYDTLKDICKKAEDTNTTTDPKEFFKTNFTPYKLIGENNKDEGLITGYYEPLLFGNLYKTAKYKYPLYAVPQDLLTIDMSSAYPSLKNYRLRGKLDGNKVIPYDTREEIEANNKDHNKVICYVDDKIDLFFLHIQGSGKVQLPNGKILNIAYAQQNGRPYYSIGRKLVEMNALKLEDVSLQSIKQWLVENPELIDEILHLNQSYVFFRNSSKSATGSLGTQLVANRNLAVDREYIPLGFPVFINTTNPISKEPINQLMIAADTGGAIKGEIRADFFFGNGKEAELLAGNMKQKGNLYIFIPNTTLKSEEK